MEATFAVETKRAAKGPFKKLGSWLSGATAGLSSSVCLVILHALLGKPAVAPCCQRAAKGPNAKRPSAGGFTLVEMLTVIVIIAILASLVTGTAIAVRRKGIVAAEGMEISQLDLALQAYKTKYGAFPPDFAGTGDNYPDGAAKTKARAAVINHLGKVYPRFIIAGADTNAKWATLTAAAAAYGVDIDQLDPSSAMVFWLGGLPDPATPGSNRLVGFSMNPKDPFELSGGRTTPLYDFAVDRLKNDGSVVRYFTKGTGSAAAPYVYFRASGGGYANNPGFTHPTWVVGGGTTGPCQDTQVAGGGWANPKTFQIRSAGLDGIFGVGVAYPVGTDYDDATMDDQTNFSGGTLEDKM